MDEQEQLFFSSEPKTNNQKVVCLGLTFNTEEERRNYFRNELRKKLPQLKEIEGFPTGEDEDIIALSDPPYYTACPNPWINDFILEWENQKTYPDLKNISPFTSDISEGRSDQLYKLHSYHTKVPYRAIAKYILHYTNPGDIIIDGFSGSGMTGLAAQLCGDENFIQKLGYTINEGKILDGNKNFVSHVGKRNTILNDLSPVATVISNSYNLSNDINNFRVDSKLILDKLKDECGYLYETKHSNTNQKGNINYTVWSEWFECFNCNHSFNFWEVAVDKANAQIMDEFSCPMCNVTLTKRSIKKLLVNVYDEKLKKAILRVKKTPVLINYTYQGKRYDKEPDYEDFKIIEDLENLNDSLWYPTDLMMNKEGKWGDTWRSGTHIGITHVHHFFNLRTLKVMSTFYNLVSNSKYYSVYQNSLRGSTSYSTELVKVNVPRLLDTGGLFSFGAVTGTLYVPSLNGERNLLDALRSKIDSYIKNTHENQLKENVVISTQSTGDLKQLKNNSIDYVFIDPPFGANLIYSELNFIYESWLKIKTATTPEAIINKENNKGLLSYLHLISLCFSEIYRVLKKGKWMTVEFSNSQASVWNAIRESIEKAGFVIANVSALDKKQGSFKAITSTTAVKQDLVITAYKPSDEMLNSIKHYEDNEDSAWNFTKNHLEKLPIVFADDQLENLIVERTPRILFDRMVAFHVQNGLSIPISSAEFQIGVSQRFPMRDGMAFLESQVLQYDKKRITIKEFSQMNLLVSDENSAIEWIRQQLLKKTQTRQDLHPYFMKEIQHIAKYEQLPELDDLLSQNFLRFDDEEGSVPTQILTYLRRNYPDLRGLDASHPTVIKKALHRWYVPDPNKQADLEKLREKALIREFNLYVEEMTKSKKKLKVFRTEAIRAGFKKAWSEKEFQTIITVGDRLPETIIQEDDKLLMYYDNAQIKLDM